MAKGKDLGKNNLLGGAGGLGNSLGSAGGNKLNLNPGKSNILGGGKSFGPGGSPHEIKAHGNVKGGGVDKSSVSRRPKV